METTLETAGFSVCKETQNIELRSLVAKVAAELPPTVGYEHTGLGNGYDTALFFPRWTLHVACLRARSSGMG